MSLRLFWAEAWTTLLLIFVWLPRRTLNESPWIGLANLDKLVHLGLFLGFAWLWMRASRSARRAAWILVLGLLLSVITEIVQGLPWIDRDPDLADTLADSLGVIAGVGAYRFLWPGDRGGDREESATGGDERWS